MNESSVMNRRPSARPARPARASKSNSIGQARPASATSGNSGSNPPVRQGNAEREISMSESGGGGMGTAQEVVFQLDDKSAQQVLLAGTFTNWDKSPIH